MITSRRTMLKLGGLALAGPFLDAMADDSVEIRMRGSPDGADVWYDPVGLRVSPGTIVSWRNTDPGNSHTTTAFHPNNSRHPLRIPKTAESWDSDYLLPGETFAVTLIAPGVYDYYCVPHEMAGMVGRIVVAKPGAPPPMEPEGMVEMFPSVVDILARLRIEK